MKLELKQVIVAFAVGALMGSVVTTRCLPGGFHGRWRDPEKSRQHMMERFTNKLMLTAEQRVQVSAILEEARGKIEALRGESRPKFQAIRESSQARIRALLTPEQQIKFDQMNAERKARFEKNKDKHRTGFGPME